jgi:hypothetical protein
MIRVVTTRGHGYTLKQVCRDRHAPKIERLDYDRLIRSRRFPRIPHVFTDLDRLSAFDLELAATVHHRLRARRVAVYNDPARVKTRFALLRALHAAGINAFNAYRLDEGIRPQRYPVFLRRDTGHGKPQSELLPDWDAARRAIDAALGKGIPATNLILVEYCAEPVRPGLFRKHALWRIGERFVPAISVHDSTWVVKYGSAGIGDEALYVEDLRRVRENPFAEVLAKAFEIAAIDYGRADFGIVGGRPQVYEINTNPTVGGSEVEHPSEARRQAQREAFRQYVEALAAIDQPRRGWRTLRLDSERLARHRGPRWGGPRSRRVP